MGSRRIFLYEHLPNRWIVCAGQDDQVFCKRHRISSCNPGWGEKKEIYITEAICTSTPYYTEYVQKKGIDVDSNNGMRSLSGIPLDTPLAPKCDILQLCVLTQCFFLGFFCFCFFCGHPLYWSIGVHSVYCVDITSVCSFNFKPSAHCYWLWSWANRHFSVPS